MTSSLARHGGELHRAGHYNPDMIVGIPIADRGR
jgi:hypothetical protein